MVPILKGSTPPCCRRFCSGDRATRWGLLPHGRLRESGGGAGEGLPRFGRGVPIQLPGGGGEPPPVLCFLWSIAKKNEKSPSYVPPPCCCRKRMQRHLFISSISMLRLHVVNLLALKSGRIHPPPLPWAACCGQYCTYISSLFFVTQVPEEKNEELRTYFFLRYSMLYVRYRHLFWTCFHLLRAL